MYGCAGSCSGGCQRWREARPSLQAERDAHACSQYGWPEQRADTELSVVSPGLPCARVLQVDDVAITHLSFGTEFTKASSLGFAGLPGCMCSC